MNVETTRFGTVEVENDRVIHFPAGLLGFSSYRNFVLLQPDDEGVFYWLQSADSPDLAFVVSDPTLWAEGYEASIRPEQMGELGLSGIESAQVFVIVNKYGQTLTGNFQGPLVINTQNRKAMQLVLADKRWSTRHEILRLAEPAAMATA